MITWAPNLSLKNCFKALFQDVNKQDLFRIWIGEGKGDVHFVSHSAYSFQLLSESFYRKYGRSPIFYFPGYFCNSSLDPLRETKCSIIFYPMDQSLNPDFKKIQNSHIKPDFFILVHYFGFQAELQSTKEYCLSVGCILVEDCAHVMVPYGDIGQYGDIVLYSLHKNSPLFNGALMICRSTVELKLTPDIQSKKNTFLFCLWLIKKIALRVLSLFHLKRTCPVDFYNNTSQRMLKKSLCSINFSLRYMSVELKQFQKNIEKRRKNYDCLYKIFSKKRDLEPFALSSNTIPYMFVIRVKNVKDSNKIYDELNRDDFLVTTWPDLPPEVLDNREEQSVAINLRYSLLFIPIHQTQDMLMLEKSLSTKRF